jgi:DNA polymerase-1
MPEDLVVQIPFLKEIISAMNIPTFERPGHEADDILGTFAHSASKEDIQTVIVTTDKDLLQMVDQNTSVYNPTKNITLDEKGVKEHFGVSPSQIIDVLALWGDSSDNIPGVPGIGEKTAKSLISQFDSLDNLLENLSDIEKESVRKKIENHRADSWSRFSKTLISSSALVRWHFPLLIQTICSPYIKSWASPRSSPNT